MSDHYPNRTGESEHDLPQIEPPWSPDGSASGSESAWAAESADGDAPNESGARHSPWDSPPQRAAAEQPAQQAPQQHASAPAEPPAWAAPTQAVPLAAAPVPPPSPTRSPPPTPPQTVPPPAWAPEHDTRSWPTLQTGHSEVSPGVVPVPQRPYPEADGVHRVPTQPAGPTPSAPPGSPAPTWPSADPQPGWPAGGAPTADDFARRRAPRPISPVAQTGMRAAVNRATLGLLRLPPSRHEREMARDIEMIRRNFGGLRQVTVVNPKGGAGKTVAILLLAMTFGQKRGGYVLAWDNNETQGTLGMRAQQDFHSRTVRDLLRDLQQFKGAHGRVGDLSQYVRSQGEAMFDVLASDESATAGEMLTAAAFAEIRDVVSRFYKLIFVDTGNNVRAQNWQAAIDATDQLVVTMSARNDSAETAARMLDHLEQSGRQRLVRQAVSVVSMPPSRKEIDLPAIQQHFAARTRAVLLAPYEPLLDSGEPIRYGGLSSRTRNAWLKIAAAVAEGL
ncbi:MAG TPA: chromosome partitioning protein [Micromonosporaceae bacterium]